MRITKEQHDDALMAMIEAVNADPGAESRILHDALRAALASLGIEIVDLCTCSPTEQTYCAADDCKGGSELYVWVERTWWDVRQGDIVRPPGVQAHEATVTEIGPACTWHVDPDSHPRWPTPMEWQARAVVMIPLGKGDESAFAPPNGVDPGAVVEIRVTRGELTAIEALGGWKERIAINESSRREVKSEIKR